ncbi:hypothetical protein [Kibdelosporangium aridum]|uniref:Uncharacterized protein n=1 Tax=Kibdelosporangium aridum TaxID=2030 RepID=A0A1W2DN84_KIBAR|nr:hypothetical protein [Kibdelosporangium aridum]SMC98960.1 hypothetical protein SAMN05661093_03616 [Kibdelosporangium aridum]
MAWEWLAPAGTVIGTLITAGLGGWIGSRHSGRIQQRQHAFDRETSVIERGRERADDAIAALRTLQHHSTTIARWHYVPPSLDSDDVTESRAAHERLGAAIEYLTVQTVRRQIELIYLVIGMSALVTRYGRTEFETTEMMIVSACAEGITVLGRYLRDEQADEPSQTVQALLNAYNRTRALFASPSPCTYPKFT